MEPVRVDINSLHIGRPDETESMVSGYSIRTLSCWDAHEMDHSMADFAQKFGLGGDYDQGSPKSRSSRGSSALESQSSALGSQSQRTRDVKEKEPDASMQAPGGHTSPSFAPTAKATAKKKAWADVSEYSSSEGFISLGRGRSKDQLSNSSSRRDLSADSIGQRSCVSSSACSDVSDMARENGMSGGAWEWNPGTGFGQAGGSSSSGWNPGAGFLGQGSGGLPGVKNTLPSPEDASTPCHASPPEPQSPGILKSADRPCQPSRDSGKQHSKAGSSAGADDCTGMDNSEPKQLKEEQGHNVPGCFWGAVREHSLDDLVALAVAHSFRVISAHQAEGRPGVLNFNAADKQGTKNICSGLRHLHAVIVLVNLLEPVELNDALRLIGLLNQNPGCPQIIVVWWRYQSIVASHSQVARASQKLLDCGADDVILHSEADIPIEINFSLQRTNAMIKRFNVPNPTHEKVESERQQNQKTLVQSLQVSLANAESRLSNLQAQVNELQAKLTNAEERETSLQKQLTKFQAAVVDHRLCKFRNSPLPPEDTNLFESEKAFGDFQLCAELGSGPFHKCYQAVNTAGALKTVRVIWKTGVYNLQQVEDMCDTFTREVNTLQRFANHPRLCKLNGVLHGQHRIYILMDDCGPHSLLQLQQREPDKRLPSQVLLDVCPCIAEGIMHLHESCGLCHRDIRQENVMVDVQGVARITGFSLVAAADKLLVRPCGRLPYVAPEVLNPPKEGYRGILTDSFAMGIMLFDCIHGIDSVLHFLQWSPKHITAKEPELSNQMLRVLEQGVLMPSKFGAAHSTKKIHTYLNQLLRINPDNRMSVKDFFCNLLLLEDFEQ